MNTDASTYSAAKSQACSPDEAARVRLAANPRSPPEILYYLAKDPAVTVRAAVATNDEAPLLAAHALACDQDPRVRILIARRLGALAPGLTDREQDRLRRQTYEALTRLVVDEVVRVREALADVLGVHGPPLKFDVSLPLASIGGFAREAADLVAAHAPEALPVLFGHIGEGNLHLNVLRCPVDRERALYEPMMELIARSGGNVSSEHGVGTRKRRYLGMSREAADIAAMRTIKAALDPTGYLNAAVLFD
jgi:FAD/FMN-containing dehydrogenase